MDTCKRIVNHTVNTKDNVFFTALWSQGKVKAQATGPMANLKSEVSFSTIPTVCSTKKYPFYPTFYSGEFT